MEQYTHRIVNCEDLVRGDLIPVGNSFHDLMTVVRVHVSPEGYVDIAGYLMLGDCYMVAAARTGQRSEVWN